MDIPLKPWEIAHNGIPQSSNTVLPYVSNTDRLHSTAVPYPGSGGGGSVTASSASGAPPLPPRPGQGQGQSQYRPLYNAGGMSNYGGYGTRPMMSYGTGAMYNSGYSSPYYNPYSSYSSPMGGMYGPSAGRISMYGQPNSGTLGEPSFSQLAEESSASAFQSIESFVSAFGSISAMLESTFHAVYSSFRAVVGVADHLGRVKQVLSTLAVFRFLRWMVGRILYLVGISKIKPEQIESLWNTLSSQNGELDPSEWENELKPGSKPSSWPILMFLGFIFAGPYLMWKLIRSLNLNDSPHTESKWATGESEHFVAVAEYDFGNPMTERELQLKRGQNIRLAPSSHQPPNVKGWVLASDGRRIGLVPTNYIKILGKRSANPVPIRTTNMTTVNHNNNISTTPPSPSLPVVNSSNTQEQEQPQVSRSTKTTTNEFLHLRPAILTNKVEKEQQEEPPAE